MDKVLYFIIILFILILLICGSKYYTFNNSEGFVGSIDDINNKLDVYEVIVGDEYSGPSVVDLKDFFNFIELFMIEDMDPRNEYNLVGQFASYGSTTTASSAINFRKGDYIIISNNIRNIFLMLNFIIKSNNKDNFYHRFLISKVGPNMQYNDRNEYYRMRLNRDELVKNKIKKEFSFLEKNVFDDYWPKVSYKSNDQYPIPHSINIHDYYTYNNIQINLLALQMLIDIIQTNDPNMYNDWVRPTENIAFEDEFRMPFKSFINSVYKIINTETYKEYLHNQKFKLKYRSVQFDPNKICN